MSSVSPEQLRAIESVCATGVEEVVQARRPDDLAALRAALREDADVPPSLRQNAIHILGRWGDTESAAAIRSLLPRFDERERINALDALGQMGGPEAEAAVLRMTEGESPDVRRFAAYALSNLGTETAQARLRGMEETDPVQWVRAAAARSRSREEGPLSP
jgi:HEAT repeat protein